MLTLKPWGQIIRLQVGLLPRVPIETIVGTVAVVSTPFIQIYGTYCVDLLISNLDVVNPLEFRLNSLTGQVNKTLAAGADIALNNVLLESVVIVPDVATGNFELLPFLLPRELIER